MSITSLRAAGRPLGLTAVVAALAISAVPAAAQSPAATGVDPIGPAETTSIVVASRLPNWNSNAALVLARELGYLDDEGISVEVVQSEDVRAAVSSGSAQVGVMEVGPLAQAVQNGVDLAMFSGFRCHNQVRLAMRPDITSVDQLNGRDVLLGGLPGDPEFNIRMQYLKDAGWDLSTVSPNYVTVPGGSNAWAALFAEDKLAITPFFSSSKKAIDDAGGVIVVDANLDTPNDVLAASRVWLAANPNTAARLTRATMRAVAFMLDMSNKDRSLEIGAANGFKTDAEAYDYEGGVKTFCDNLYLEPESTARLLVDEGFENPPTFEQIADITPLLAAQASLGLDNTPVPLQ